MNSRTQRIGLGLLLAAGMLVLGAVVGGFLSKLGDQPGMGWDQLARALGWMMGGGVAGIVLAIFVARGTNMVTLRITTLIVVLVAGTMVIGAMVSIRREQARADATTAAEAARMRTMTPTAEPVPVPP